MRRIEPVASLEDISLPADRLQVLEEIAAQVRRRLRAHQHRDSFVRRHREQGTSVLFSGPDEAAKAIAAEALAGAIGLDLHRVDSRAVVRDCGAGAKEALRRSIDTTEGACAHVLLFDEADALFGTRSEVHDSHDRYANVDANYLLRRLKANRGLTILAARRRQAFEEAFLRRLRFAVEFS